jgi:hypothetical protein
MRAVASDLGYDASHLCKHFPELCKAISAKYLEYKQLHKAERVEALRHKVRRVTLLLHEQVMYPSHRLMKSELDTPRLMYEPEAIRTWHEMLRQLGYER